MRGQWLFQVCNFLFKKTLCIFARPDISGRENFPRKGPLIVVSNHLSTVDPAIVAAVVPRIPGFLAKKELFRNRAVRILMTSYGAFPVDRGKADMRAINWAVRRLRAGGCIILFPEGTRSRGHGLLEAQQGAALLARLTGAPIVPVALTGSEPLQNLAQVVAPIAHLKVVIGKPFWISDSGAGRGAKKRDLLERATLEMMVRIAQLLPESYRGHYAGSVGVTFDATTDVAPARAPGADAPE